MLENSVDTSSDVAKVVLMTAVETNIGSIVAVSVVNIDAAVVASVASVVVPKIVATSATMVSQESGLCSMSFFLKYLKIVMDSTYCIFIKNGHFFSMVYLARVKNGWLLSEQWSHSPVVTLPTGPTPHSSHSPLVPFTIGPTVRGNIVHSYKGMTRPCSHRTRLARPSELSIEATKV